MEYSKRETFASLSSPIGAIDMVRFFARHRNCWNVRLLTSSTHEPISSRCWNEIEKLWLQSTQAASEYYCSTSAENDSSLPCWCDTCDVQSISGRVRVIVFPGVFVDVIVSTKYRFQDNAVGSAQSCTEKINVELRPHSAILVPVEPASAEEDDDLDLGDCIENTDIEESTTDDEASETSSEQIVIAQHKGMNTDKEHSFIAPRGGVQDGSCSLMYQYKPRGATCSLPELGSKLCNSPTLGLRLVTRHSQEASENLDALLAFELDVAMLEISDIQSQQEQLVSMDRLGACFLFLWGDPEAVLFDEMKCGALSTLYSNSEICDYLPPSFNTLIPQQFLQWMDEDSIIVPEAILQLKQANTASSDDDDHTNQFGKSIAKWGASLKTQIQKLGGQVWPKLDWNSPKDTAWVRGGLLPCTSVEEIFILLKSSVRITDVLDAPFKRSVESRLGQLKKDQKFPFYLCLRKWQNLNEGLEFRVFFWGSNICGISQRSTTKLFPFLAGDEKFVEHLKSKIVCFFRKLYPDLSMVLSVKAISSDFSSFCCRGALDIYFEEPTTSIISEASEFNTNTEQLSNKYLLECRLWDYSTWGLATDSLLFSWSELRDRAFEAAASSIEFRLVSENMGGGPFVKEDIHALPKDLWSAVPPIG